MGQLIIISEFLKGDAEEDVKESLQLLQKVLSAKMKAFAIEMEKKSL